MRDRPTPRAPANIGEVAWKALEASFVQVSLDPGRRSLPAREASCSSFRSALCGASDIAGNSSTLATAKRHMRAWRRRDVSRSAINRSGTRRTGKRRAAPVIGDQIQCLRWVIR